jgi:hypothetical protein
MLTGGMTRSLIGGLLVVVAYGPFVAWGAPCIQACKDEIAACVSAECESLPTKKQRRHCKRICARTIVKDCYSDLSVCGATTARPVRQPTGGSGGQPPTGGW